MNLFERLKEKSRRITEQERLKDAVRGTGGILSANQVALLSPEQQKALRGTAYDAGMRGIPSKTLAANYQAQQLNQVSQNLMSQINNSQLPEDTKQGLKGMAMLGQFDKVVSALNPTPTKQPTSYQEYTLSDKTPTTEEYNLFLKNKSGPSTVIDQRGETKFVEESVTSGFADIKETRAIVATSNELLPRLEAASLIIQSEKFDTGPTADAFLDVKKLYEDVTGVDVENITNQEVFKALANFTVPRMRPPGSGATSDFEANLFSTATFGLQNTKEGNEIIIGTMMQNAKRDKELLKLKEQYISLSKGEEGKTSIKGSTLGFDAWLSDNDLVPPLYKQINLSSENIGELYDNKQIRNGQVYIDMSDPRNPQLRVFRLTDFDD